MKKYECRYNVMTTAQNSLKAGQINHICTVKKSFKKVKYCKITFLNKITFSFSFSVLFCNM